MLTRLMSAPESTQRTRDWARAKLRLADMIDRDRVSAAGPHQSVGKTAAAQLPAMAKDTQMRSYQRRSRASARTDSSHP